MTLAAPDISDIPALLALLERQVFLYEKLLELADRQHDLIEHGNAESLLTVLGQRQRLIDEVGRLNGEMEPYRANWDSFWSIVPGAQQQRVAELIQKSQSLNRRIAERDDADRRLLNDMKQQVGGQVRQTTSAGQAVRAYGRQPSANHSRFTNQQG